MPDNDLRMWEETLVVIKQSFSLLHVIHEETESEQERGRRHKDVSEETGSEANMHVKKKDTKKGSEY